MQCKDIPDLPVLDFIGRCERGEVAHSYSEPRGKVVTFYPPATWFGYEPRPGNTVLHAMPPGTPEKLGLAKVRMLKRRGLVDGCCCGCRGDFELTDKGRALLGDGGLVLRGHSQMPSLLNLDLEARMNEQIAKMAREAGMVQAANADRAWTTEQCDGVLPATLERFAQLIAARCAEICVARMHYWQQGDMRRHEDASCAATIAAEFGLEKL